MKNKKNIVITGAAGFIGAALVIRLLERGENIIGIDNLNNYYDVNLKKARLEEINKLKGKTLVIGIFIISQLKMIQN